jgi:Tol biopolymer transport system component
LNLHSLVPRPTSASRAFDCRERSHASAITAWRTLLILVAFVFVRAGNAQNHPELHWQVLETEHFRVLYHEGLETAAGKAAEVAEEAYGPTTKLYGYEPRSKVRIILKDYDDFANGAAYFFQDTIEIWTTALEHDYELRGTTDWLRNVVTHEFTHIVSLGAARKGPQRIPAIYIQYFGYQREKDRPDVLTGFPDRLVSYPLMTINVPHWFSEGVAQYHDYDRWDSHRDMILRIAVLNYELLSMDDMGVFGKRGFGNEFVYDHGFSLVRYIAHTYGEEKLAELARAASGWTVLDFGGAIEEVLEISAEGLHLQWREAMHEKYTAQVASLGELREGEELAGTGFSNMWPEFSPDGKKLAFLSSLKRHYGSHSLVIRDLESEEDEVVVPRVSTSSISWSANGRKLLFVRKDRADKYGSRQADVYELDLDDREVGFVPGLLATVPGMLSGYSIERLRRISSGLRGFYPRYSPDGNWIAFVHNQGTNNNLGLLSADGEEVRYLTQIEDGTQLYTPRWSPDGRFLVFSIGREGRRDIGLLEVAKAERQFLASTEPVAFEPPRIELIVNAAATDRDPVFTRDGNGVLFASDVSGIFNIYKIDLATREVSQLTNVKGGALAPTEGLDGQVAFVAYDGDGYKIRQVNLAGAVSAQGFRLNASDSHLDPVRVSSGRVAVSEPYRMDFLQSAVLPRVMIDEGEIKPGFYVGTGDVLGRQNIFAGLAAAPANGDRDLFLIYELKKWRPTLFAEFFHQRRHASRGDSSEARDAVINAVNFNLNQVSVGLRGNLGRPNELSVSLTYDRYDASIEFDRFVPKRDGTLGFDLEKQKPFGYTYLNGFDLGFTYRHNGVARTQDRDINPKGRRIFFRYDRVFNYFLEDFDRNTTFIKEEYKKLFYNQLTLDWNEFVPLPWNTTFGLRFFGGWIDNEEVDDPELIDDFFDYRLGGLPFMKGYTFYSLEGRKAAMTTASLRFPLISSIRRRFAHIYFERLYGTVYADVGKAWDKNFDDPDPVFGRKAPLRDVGGQLRLDMLSYYGLPTRIQFDGAYGIDEISDKQPWKFYLTVLFGYL